VVDEATDADKRINLIACIPVNTEEFQLPPFEPTEGYKVIECDCCHQWVWIGPKQLALRLKDDMDALCVVCIAVLAKQEGCEPGDVTPINVDDMPR
jgi:hypothetical protein